MKLERYDCYSNVLPALPEFMSMLIHKRHMQTDMLRCYSKLIGCKTRLSVMDSLESIKISDDQLMSVPYNCSMRDRHERTQKKQHHHDLRRRKERYRQRRRHRRRQRRVVDDQNLVQDAERSSGAKRDDRESTDADESDREDREDISKRRIRWRKMEEKIRARDNSAHHMSVDHDFDGNETDSIVGLGSTSCYNNTSLDVVDESVQQSTTRRPETLKRTINIKTKPKISISLNLAASSLVSNKIEDEEQSTVGDLLYSSSLYQTPYPVIDDKSEVNTIHKFLLSRKHDIELRLSDVVFQLNTQAETQPDIADTKLHEKADILRGQIRKMDTQLDYIQTRIEIESMKMSPGKSQKEKEDTKKQITSLVNRMRRLHQTMKEANRQHSKLQHNSEANTSVPDRDEDDQFYGNQNLQEPDIFKTDSRDAEDPNSKRGLTDIKSKITNLLEGSLKISKGMVPSISSLSDRRKPRNGPQRRHPQTTVQDRQKRHEELMTMLKTDDDLNSKVCSQIDSLVHEGCTDGDPVLRALGVEAKKRLGANRVISQESKDFEETHVRGNTAIFSTQRDTCVVDVDEREFPVATSAPSDSSHCNSSTVAPAPLIESLITSMAQINGHPLSDITHMAQPIQGLMFNVPRPSHMPAVIDARHLGYMNSQMFLPKLDIPANPCFSGQHNFPATSQIEANKAYDIGSMTTNSEQPEWPDEPVEAFDSDESQVSDSVATDANDDLHCGFVFKNIDECDQTKQLNLGCGLFASGGNNLSGPHANGTDSDSTESGGVLWALNEISRLLAKQNVKYSIYGGPYVRRIYGNGSFSDERAVMAGDANFLSSFSSLSSLLFTDRD